MKVGNRTALEAWDESGASASKRRTTASPPVEGYHRLARASGASHPSRAFVAALYHGPLIRVQEDHPVFDCPGQ